MSDAILDPTTTETRVACRPASNDRPSRVGPIRAFRFLRGAMFRNVVGNGLAGSRIRALTILACSVVFWLFLFAFFFEGFNFVNSFGVEFVLFEYVFGLFFLSLLIMLMISTAIILYAGLFHSREAAFLMATPAREDRVFAHKFLEAVSFSSWGFLLLGTPMLTAYGIVTLAPPSYYALFLGYLVGFVVIAGGLGAAATLIVANVVPRREKTVLVLLGVVALALFGVCLLRLRETPGQVMTQEWINGLLDQLSFTQSALLPSRWTGSGLIAGASGRWGTSLYYLGVLLSHAGLAYVVAAVLARDLYRRGFDRVQGHRSARRRFGWYGFDAAFHRAFGILPHPVRLLILKDLRTFRRDTAQWSQFLIFFGLLAFYFINIRQLNYDAQPVYWRYVLSFLNLAVTALLLSTFTSRFIFPLMSLEGRNYWILGLFPLDRSSILWGKFAFATGISLVATESLILISDIMLRMGVVMTVLHMILIAILCLGLSGISVGLGARLTNLKEEDPSKIATGFGGTLNLLVSLAFIVLVVATIALPCQVYFASRDMMQALPEAGGGVSPGMVPLFADPTFRLWIGLGMTISVVLGIIATVVPLRVGIRAFRTMEL